MIGQPRIGKKPLGTLCRKMATSLAAGVDARTVLAREAKSAHGSARSRMAQINANVQRGGSFCDAVDQTGKYYPDFFREMVRVGEESGHLAEVLRQLAEHYEHQVQLRRVLLSSLAWPMLELLLASGVIGIVIFLMGAIPQLANNNIDILGFGLTGTEGLVKYLALLAACGFVFFLFYRATTRGVLWVAPIQRLLMRIPTLGGALETFAMARLSWAMHVTLNSGMDLRKALKLSLNSTHNVLYTQHVNRILAAIQSGDEIHEALGETGAFPIHFIEAVQVGEESGQLVESLANLSSQYQNEARSAMNTLTVLLGVAVTGMIAAMIIFMIFRVFSFYTGVLDDALKM